MATITKGLYLAESMKGLGPLPIVVERNLDKAIAENTSTMTKPIDIDEAKRAFAMSTMCQHTFFKPGTEVNPHMLCAVSAMVVHAGMTPELWGSLVQDPTTLWRFARPVLTKKYNIPEWMSQYIPPLFDGEKNEWRGVERIIRLFEDYNRSIQHSQAIQEDTERFPQLGPFMTSKNEWMFSFDDVSDSKIQWTGLVDYYPYMIDHPYMIDNAALKYKDAIEKAFDKMNEVEQQYAAMSTQKKMLEKAKLLKSQWL